MRPEKGADTYQGLTRAQATGEIQGCLRVKEENTNKGMNLMRMCDLGGRKLFVHYKQDLL